jgi:hypothetical protein
MVLSVMEFLIYLQIDDGKLYLKTMEPKDTLSYEYVLSDKIENDLPEGFDQEGMEKINKVQAMICHSKLMELRLNMKQHNTPGAKLQRLEKYYVNVLSSYVDFFEGKKFQLPQWKLDEDNIPRFATNLVTGENIRLSRKQGRFVKLFYKHFCNSKIGEEWMWFSEAWHKLDERHRNDRWNGMTDIFEKTEGRDKLKRLFDSNLDGRIRYYRIKTVI